MNIGIFWYWNNFVIGISHNSNIEDADSLGLIDSPYTHIEYWHELQKKYPELLHYEYEEIPRGRVIFNTKQGVQIIYLDETLLYKSKVDRIYSFFKTSKENSKLYKDPHYKV